MATSHLLRQPDGTSTLGEVLLTALADPQWTTIRASVAYAKMSGVKHISGPLQAFGNRADDDSWLVVGIDQQGSSLEAVEELFLLVNDWGGGVFILQNPTGNPSPTFHPKLWFFTNVARTAALLIAGSGNLTEGGLYTNYEAGTITTLDSRRASDAAIISEVDTLFGEWTDSSQPHVLQASLETLQKLHDSGDLPSEDTIRRARKVARSAAARLAERDDDGGSEPLFAGTSTKPAPVPDPRADLSTLPRVVKRTPHMASSGHSTTPTSATTSSDSHTIAAPSFVPQYRVLLMTLRPQNMTELFLTKGVLKEDPAFFGLPFTGLTTPKKLENEPQPQPDPLPTVSLTTYSSSGAVAGHEPEHSLKMWTYLKKGEFRLTIPSHMMGDVPNDTILRMERDPNIPGLDYSLEFYPPGHPDYSTLLALCTNSPPNSQRRYGWQ